MGATVAVGAAAGAEATGALGADDVEDERFIPPTIPPIRAAATIKAKRTVNSIQKMRFRIPHILRGLGSGGRGSSSSIVFIFAGVHGVSGTIVVPAMAEVNVDSIGESIEVGES